MQTSEIYIDQLNEIFCLFWYLNCCDIPKNEYLTSFFFASCKISQKWVTIVVSDSDDI